MKSLFRESDDKRVFDYIFGALILVLFNQTFHSYLSNVINILICILIVVLCLWSWLLYSSKHPIPPLLKYFGYLIIYLVLVGFLNGWSFSNNDIGLMLMQDIRYVMLFLLGGIFAIYGNMKYFHKIMKVFAWVSIIFAIPALLFFDYSIDSISGRNETWSMNYFFWWCSCSCFCYWGYYALIEKKDRFLGFGTLAVYAFLGTLFLKRSALINVFVIFVINALFSKNKIRSILTLVFCMAAFWGILMIIRGDIISNLFQLMASRFDVDVEELEEIDRSVEANLYFQESGLLKKVFGNGIGHYFYSRTIRLEAGGINALHIGWANLIYKGGVLYVLYYLGLYWMILKNILMHSKKSNYDMVCYGVALSSLVSMFYEGSWTYTLQPFCISAPIFYAALNRRSKIVR